jgi:hypothetical protein
MMKKIFSLYGFTSQTQRLAPRDPGIRAKEKEKDTPAFTT